MPLISRKQKTAVGLDIGSYSIKLVEMRHTNGSYEITNVGIKKLLPGAIVDGEPMDRDAVVSAIREVFEETGVINRNVVSAICGRSVIVKKIRLDEMDEDLAREVITVEAEQYVPFEREELSVDFEILRRGLPENTMEVLLVAAKKDRVISHVELLRDADLVPAVIDVDAFAVQNAFELNYEYEEDKVYALIDIGLSATNIGIVSNGLPLFNRDIQFGGQTFIEGMQRKLGITSEEARAALEGIPGAKPDEVLRAIETVGEELCTAIERSFSYLRSSGDAERVDRIYLSGGGSLISGLRSLIAEKLGIEVELANPLRNIEFREEILGADPVSIGPSLMVAIGLATRQGS